MNTPNTVDFMIAGYAAFGIIMILYLISLAVRFRRLKREFADLARMVEKS